MKILKLLTVMVSLLVILTACDQKASQVRYDAIDVELSDSQVLVDGQAAGTATESAVYLANDIIYYEAGKDFTYGEGTEADAHTPEAAAAHTVVHITKPGAYRLSGKLSKGQIAVDLGENAEEDPNAVVTLILNGVDITCEVAPAVIFYNVYECGDAEKASKDVDTAAAGANVILADGSENTVNGAYVARIYKPESVQLNEAGTAVEDAKKLHKYDGAFYSRMSMNINGERKNTGVLNILAANEGLDSELHLTLNGGNVNIRSGNDGINTNEDGISVTTVNGGTVNILVTGQTGEGDGIDSNGWLVINGGTVVAAACAKSADAGIDSDMGIHINGGTVIATGQMLDRIQEGGQTYAVFTFAQKQGGTETVSLKDEKGKTVLEHCPQNAYTVMVCSSPELKAGTYTLWSGDRQLAGQGSGMAGGPGMRPGGMQPPEGWENKQPPDGMEPTEGRTPPEGQTLPEGAQPPERPEGGFDKGQRPDGQGRNPGMGKQDRFQSSTAERSTEFKLSEGGNMFSGITFSDTDTTSV